LVDDSNWNNLTITVEIIVTAEIFADVESEDDVKNVTATMKNTGIPIMIVVVFIILLLLVLISRRKKFITMKN